MGQSIRTILWSSAVRWKSRKQIGGLKCRPGCSTGRHALTPGFSQFYSECSKFGASEENRTPDSQIRRLGPSTLNARGSRSDHNFLRRATARQKSRSDPRQPGLPVSRNRPRPTLAGGLHMPPSRRTAEAGFKDSAVKKLACLPRIRPSPGAAMVTTWPARGPPIRVSTAVLHRPNPVAREIPGFIGVFARRDQVAEREGFSPPFCRPPPNRKNLTRKTAQHDEPLKRRRSTMS